MYYYAKECNWGKNIFQRKTFLSLHFCIFFQILFYFHPTNFDPFQFSPNKIWIKLNGDTYKNLQQPKSKINVIPLPYPRVDSNKLLSDFCIFFYFHPTNFNSIQLSPNKIWIKPNGVTNKNLQQPKSKINVILSLS